jgi:PAS domain S-box-containing protein
MELIHLPASVILKVNILLIQIGIGLLILTALLFLHFYLYKKMKNRYSKKSYRNALREKDLLEQLINTMPDRIYFKDRESRFIIANKHVSRIMGEEDPKKLIGNTDFDFHRKELAQEYYDDDQRIMASGKPMINKEEIGLDLKGNDIIISTTKIPVRDSLNQVIGIIGIGRDISKQKDVELKLTDFSKQLQEANALLEERQEEIEQISENLRMQTDNLANVNKELEKLSLVASKTENVLLIMDAKGCFEWANDGFTQKYGMDLGTFKNKFGGNLRANSSNPEIDTVLDQIVQTGKPSNYISCFTDKDNNEHWSQTNISPIYNSENEITHLVLIDTDITDLKKAEEQIRAQNVEITAQSTELHSLNTTKNKLFSIIGHDLKNPLSSIIGFSELLQNNHSSITADKVKKYSEIIYGTSRSAYQLLENLLDWARMQTDQLKVNPAIINLRLLIDEITPLQKAAASEKKIHLVNEVNNNLHVLADRNMLNTIVRNITGNAIKYTKAGGKVTFSATLKNEEVRLMIKDTGIGMTRETMENLFLPEKTQSTPGTSGETGTGLGLIISKEFVERNEGRIEVDSAPGKGTTFTVILPAKELS